MRQLRWQIMLVFVLLVILTLLIIELLTLPRMHQQAEEQVFAQLNSVADIKYDYIRYWITNSQSSLGLLLTPPLKQTIRVLLANPSSIGQQQVVNGLLHESLSSSEGMTKSLFTSIFVYDLQGNIIASSDVSQIGKIVTRQPYYRPSLIDNTFQKPFYPLGSNTLSMVVTQHIHDSNDDVLGIVAAELNMAALSEIMLQRSGLGQSGETYLVSHESNYLLTPSRAEGFSLTQAYHSIGIDAGLRGENGQQIYQDYRLNAGRRVLGVYRWLPELDAALLAEIDEKEALRALYLVQNNSILAAVAIAIGAGLVGLYIATRLTAPVSALTHAAIRIAQGDFAQRASVKTSNEIGVLAQTFNSMAGQLGQIVQELEDRVVARTSDLQQALAQREQTVADLQESLEVREQLSATIRELSSPVLPVRDDALIVPLIGVIDEQRAQLLMSAILQSIEKQKARTVIIDVTGVPLIDTQVAQALVQTAKAAQLLGAQPVLVGIRPELAQTIVGLGVDLRAIRVYADLRSALALH